MIVVTFFTTFFQRGKQDRVAWNRGTFPPLRPGPRPRQTAPLPCRSCRYEGLPPAPPGLGTRPAASAGRLSFHGCPSSALPLSSLPLCRAHRKNFSFATGRARRKTYLEDASERDAAKAFTDTVFISPRRIHICPKSSASTLGPPTPVSTSWKARTPSASPILRAAAPLPPWWLSPIRNAWWARSPNVRP